MYYANINNLDNGFFVPDKFKACLDFMKKEYRQPTKDVSEVQLTDKITAHFQSYTTVEYDDIQFESHQKYYDIQFVLSGQEILMVRNPNSLQASTEYDAQNDIIFYDDPQDTDSQIILRAGDFAILGISDAHKPKVAIDGPEAVNKIVIKIPIE